MVTTDGDPTYMTSAKYCLLLSLGVQWASNSAGIYLDMNYLDRWILHMPGFNYSVSNQPKALDKILYDAIEVGLLI
jgi:hypothetical protein